MSKYKEIKTEFLNPASLEKALTDLGIKFEKSADPKKNDVKLVTHWRSHGGYNTNVAFGVQKDDAEKYDLGSSPNVSRSQFDGFGFSWNGSGYDYVHDEYDRQRSKLFLDKISQRYAYHEITRQARAKGYSVREVKSENAGTIRLQLVHR